MVLACPARTATLRMPRARPRLCRRAGGGCPPRPFRRSQGRAPLAARASASAYWVKPSLRSSRVRTLTRLLELFLAELTEFGQEAHACTGRSDDPDHDPRMICSDERFVDYEGNPILHWRRLSGDEDSSEEEERVAEEGVSRVILFLFICLGGWGRCRRHTAARVSAAREGGPAPTPRPRRVDSAVLPPTRSVWHAVRVVPGLEHPAARFVRCTHCSTTGSSLLRV